MTKAQIIDKYIRRIMVDYPEADKIHIDLVQFAEELRQCDVSGALPLNMAIYRNAQSMDYKQFCQWFNQKLGGNDR